MEQDHASDELEPGSVVEGRYRLASVAARNGAEITFHALDERTRQRVRIRLSTNAPDPALLRLHHPGIPRVVDHGRVGRFWFTALEWFDGAPIELPLAPIGGDRARMRVWAGWAMDLLDALAHVHQNAGRAHGDLGLHSVWLGRDGRVRIVDASAPELLLSPASIPFASPERLRGLDREPTSDLYSLACLLYALAYGTPPFGADPVHARSGHLLRTAPDAPPGAIPLPAPFLDALRVAMDKQPHHRFAAAARMRAAFDDAIRLLDTLPEVPTALRATHGWDEAETVRVERRSLGEGREGGPTASQRPGIPLVERPWAADEELAEEPEPAFGTLDTSPERVVAPPRRRVTSGIVLVFGASVLGVAATAFALTLVLGSVAWWATTPSAAPPPPLLPLPPVERPHDDGATVAPAAHPGSDRVPVRLDQDTYRARPGVTFPEFVQVVQQWPGKVRLTGHTDSRGPASVNERVGLGRAWAVQQLLGFEGVKASRLPIASKGEREPVADNATPEGRAANRRVTAEFLVPVAPGTPPSPRP